MQVYLYFYVCTCFKDKACKTQDITWFLCLLELYSGQKGWLLAIRGGRRGVEELGLPQANRPDKIRVEGVQLDAFLNWPLSPPLSNFSKPLVALFLPVLSVSAFYLLMSLSCLSSPFRSQAPESIALSITLYFSNIVLMLGVSLVHFFSFCMMSALLFLTLLPPCHLLCLPSPPLSRTSVKWGQPLACNAMSFFCSCLALWPRSLILASLNWPITFHVFPWAMS